MFFRKQKELKEQLEYYQEAYAKVLRENTSLKDRLREENRQKSERAAEMRIFCVNCIHGIMDKYGNVACGLHCSCTEFERKAGVQ